MLYLDHAASSPIIPDALETLNRAMREDFANPSSAHRLGKDIGVRVEKARQWFKNRLGAGAQDVLLFTSSATEANNQVFQGLDLTTGDEVWICHADHPSLVRPLKALGGLELREIPLTSDGSYDLESLISQLTDKTRLVVLCHVNNQTGVCQDVVAASTAIKKISPNIFVHVDAVQSFCKVALSFDKNFDSLTVSSHKVAGPKGIGALLLKSNTHIKPLLYGGRQCDAGLRSSTLAAPLIFAFHKAAEVMLIEREQHEERARDLNYKLRQRLIEAWQTVRFPYPLEQTSPFVLTFLVPGLSSDILLRHLEQRQIYLASSSACSSKIKKENPVYKALGIPADLQKSVLRLSFGIDFNESMLEIFITHFKEVMNDLKIYLK